MLNGTCVLSCCSKKKIQARSPGSLRIYSLHFTLHSILADGGSDEELQQQNLWT